MDPKNAAQPQKTKLAVSSQIRSMTMDGRRGLRGM